MLQTFAAPRGEKPKQGAGGRRWPSIWRSICASARMEKGGAAQHVWGAQFGGTAQS